MIKATDRIQSQLSEDYWDGYWAGIDDQAERAGSPAMLGTLLWGLACLLAGFLAGVAL